MEENKNKTCLINLLGQPSAGKSTTMADLFQTLKYQGKNVEMCSEWVKKWAWEDKKIGLLDQFYIFGKETQQQSRLINKVDYIISDSPVYLTAFYQKHYTGKESLLEPVLEFYEILKEQGVEVKTYFLIRNKEYNPQGRYQTADEAQKVADQLQYWLWDYEIPVTKLCCQDKDRVKLILDDLGIKETVK